MGTTTECQAQNIWVRAADLPSRGLADTAKGADRSGGVTEALAVEELVVEFFFLDVVTFLVAPFGLPIVLMEVCVVGEAELLIHCQLPKVKIQHL